MDACCTSTVDWSTTIVFREIFKHSQSRPYLVSAHPGQRYGDFITYTIASHRRVMKMRNYLI